MKNSLNWYQASSGMNKISQASSFVEATITTAHKWPGATLLRLTVGWLNQQEGRNFSRFS